MRLPQYAAATYGAAWGHRHCPHHVCATSAPPACDPWLGACRFYDATRPRKMFADCGVQCTTDAGSLVLLDLLLVLVFSLFSPKKGACGACVPVPTVSLRARQAKLQLNFLPAPGTPPPQFFSHSSQNPDFPGTPPHSQKVVIWVLTASRGLNKTPLSVQRRDHLSKMTLFRKTVFSKKTLFILRRAPH